jgi:hypothetical protein
MSVLEPSGMEFLFIIADAPDAEPWPDEPPASDWGTEMDERGVRIRGNRLRPAADATTVRRRGDELLVTGGAIADTPGARDWTVGYDVIECADLAEAVEIAALHPMARYGRVEIRPAWPFE